MEPTPPAPPPGASPDTALGKYVGAAQKHKFYADEWADGKEVVGYNNLGEIRIEIDGNGKPTATTQILYWKPEKALLQTNYRASFVFQDPACS